MTRTEALDLLQQYSVYIRTHCSHVTRENTILDRVADAPRRFPKSGSKAKAMRWLGWAQGVLEASGVFAPQDIENHSRTRIVCEPLP